MDKNLSDTLLVQIQSLYRLRVYLYAFHAFLRSFSDDERLRLRLQRGIDSSFYCKDMIQLVEFLISDFSERLSRFCFDDLPAD